MFGTSLNRVLFLLLLMGIGLYSDSRDDLTKIETSSIAVPQTFVGPQMASLEAAAPKNSNNTLPVVSLGMRNTLTFREAVTDQSVARFQRALLNMSANLPRTETIYLVIDSPGGSVFAGSLLIDTVAAVPQKVKTLTIFSASMAFHMVQSMDERLILPSGTLMSHRAQLGGMGGEVGGDGKGEMMTRLNWIIRRLAVMDAAAAKRMGMSVPDYQALIADEYWVTGADSVQAKAADKVVVAKCSPEMLKAEEVITVETFFGDVFLTYSKCPLLTFPHKIAMRKDAGADKRLLAESDRFVDTLVYDRPRFVKEYVTTGKYSEWLK